MRLRSIGSLALLGLAGSFGCSSSHTPAAASAPPAPTTSTNACIISADCPAATYCDLGQCIQQCNASAPCTDQDQACSARARCLAPNQPDTDPPPPTQSAGTVTATQTNIALTDSDTQAVITLTSTSANPVKYRVAPHASYLSINAPRGELTSTGTITLKVDPTQVQGTQGDGTVEIVTELGTVTVAVPIHVGVTGTYVGQMTYNGGPINLGNARLAMDVIESGGDVSIHLQPGASLLFPKGANGDVTGHGLYDDSNGLDVTVGQVLPSTFANGRNPFGRDIGQWVRFQLKKGTNGLLSGTFTETDYGIFGQPVTTTGTVVLQLNPQAPAPTFMLGPDPVVPPAGAPDPNILADLTALATGTFPGWTGTAADTLACFTGGCDDNGLVFIENTATQSLETSFSSSSFSYASYDTIAAGCAQVFQMPTLLAYRNVMDEPCSLPQLLGMSLMVRTTITRTDHANATHFGTTLMNFLAAPLEVAKNDYVTALTGSFSSDLSTESGLYTDAMSTLQPWTIWAVRPEILEFLRGMAPADAKGPVPTTNQTQSATFPALRSLADLFSTEATIDAQRAQISAADATGQPSLAQFTQQRAIISLLEARIVSELMNDWSGAAPSLGAKFVGVLSPLNQAYAALIQGADVFGVPSGFVPFVYRPEDVAKGPTNFEQMLAIAQTSVSAEGGMEANFKMQDSALLAGESALQMQLNGVVTQFNGQITAACGAGVDPGALSESDLLAACQTGAGSIGVLQLQVQQAQLALSVAQSRITGMQQKIQIDQNTLAATQSLQSDQIGFVDSTGQQIGAIDFAEGILTVEEKVVDIASRADIGNAGAPIGESILEAIIGTEKVALDTQKQQLQLGEQLEALQVSQEEAYITGMANIQKEVIDLAQAGVEIGQNALQVTQAQLVLQNALANVQVLYEQRARQLDILMGDPTKDPSYRLLADQFALQVMASRTQALTELDLAAKALQYELNMSIDGIDGAVINARNNVDMTSLAACMTTIFNSARVVYGTPQDYVTTVSVRELLGITGPRTDEVTGQVLSEGDQFRVYLLQNQNFDGAGGVSLHFSTDLQPGNKLWSANVCEDRIATVQAQLVGDFLGDNQAEVDLSLSGGAVMRSCSDGSLTSWSMGGGDGSNAAGAVAVIGAGVNTFGTSPANNSLFGESVARATWTLAIPGGANAPANADVDVTKIDDVVLNIDHKAAPLRNSPVSIDVSCLGNIGQ